MESRSRILSKLLLFATLLAGWAERAHSATLVTNFVETAIGGTWNEAVGMTWGPGPDHHMFVWERGGRVWLLDDGVKQATPFLDIHDEVGGWRDFGLLGFTLDPNFASNGYVYLLYVVDHHHLTKAGTTNYNPNTDEYFQATIGRITRYTANAADGFHTVKTNSRLVLLGESISNGIPILYESHGVGGLIFGRDGTLMASTGDGASYSTVDTGSASETYFSSALSQGIIKTKENVGAFRSQLVDSLNGKLLRIDPATGNGVPSNPFYDPANPRSARSRTWALGFRNPCRITLKPGTGSTNPAAANPGVIYSGDVGMNTWEDLNVCTGPGQNFGWPIFEGLEAHANYSVATTTNYDAPNPLSGSGGCKPFFAFRDLLIQDTLNTPSWPNPCNSAQQIPTNVFRFVHRRPSLDWKHGTGPARTGIYSGNNAGVINVGAAGSPVSGAQFVGNCSIGGTWYTNTDFPLPYRNTYFHAEYGAQWIKCFKFDANNNPVSVTNFVDNAGGVVFVATDPVDGGLYYISWATVLKKISYVGPINKTPTAVIASDKTYGPGPLTVQFTGSGSSDPEGLPLSYRWNFGDGSTNATANPSHIFNAPPGVPAAYSVTLIVTDTEGLSATNSMTIAVNNSPPTVTITSPPDGCRYPMSAPTAFNLTANVSDAESTYTCKWQVFLHHNEHEHEEPPDFNCATTAIISPIGCDDASYYYRIQLTVTDTAGLATKKEVRVYPDCPNQTQTAYGLLGEYYDNIDLTGLKFKRLDPNINFNWGNNAPDTSIGVDSFSARWTGKILPQFDETYTFYTTSDDGMRLWIDNVLVIDSWIDQSAVEHSGTVTLKAGIKSDIKVEYYENGGGAVAQLAWSSPSTPKAVVPASALFPPQTPYAFQQESSTNALAVVEAENYFLNLTQASKTWTATNASGASGNALIALPNSGTSVNTGYDTSSPRLDFPINFIRTGTHYIWVRGFGAGSSDRTIHAGLDGLVNTNADRLNGFSSAWAWSKATMDGSSATVNVTNTGIHTVNIWMREDGFVADKILVTTNANYTPTGTGPAPSLMLSNAPPLVSDLANQNIPEDSICGPLNFTISSPRLPFNELGITGSSSNPALVPTTNIFFSGCGANRTVTVVPLPNRSGTTTITVVVSDGITNATDSFVLTVTAQNDAPTVTNDDYATSEDVALNVSAPGVLSNDTDPDGDVLRALVASGPAHGSLTLNTNGAFLYTPATNYNGPDSFTYRVTDGSLTSAVVTVSITVTPVNDPPVATNDTYGTPEDLALIVPASGVLANDGDIDSAILTAMLATGPTHGALALNTNGSFTYTPATNYNGPDSFTYRATDGAATSAVATVILTVTPVNDPPIAANDSFSTLEDTVLNVPAAGVLTNDSDIDGGALTALLVNGPSHGQLTLNPNGSFTYTPTNNFNGVDSFTYRANDGLSNSAVATVSLTIVPVNDAPVAVADQFETLEDIALIVPAAGVLTNDTDIEGNALSAQLVSAPLHGTLTLNTNGSFTFQPATNYNGPDTFTYRASDGVSNSTTATVSLTVQAVNDAPVASDDNFTTLEDMVLSIPAGGVLTNDTDVDSGSLTALLVNGPNHGQLTLNPNGSFSYTPTNDFNGADSFTYRANDGSSNSATATVNLTIAPVNDAPTAIADHFETLEDTALIVPAGGVLTNDTDIEGNALTALLVDAPQHGTIMLNFDGSFSYQPETNYNGADSFTYRASDGVSNSAIAIVSLTVQPANDPPSLSSISNQTTLAGIALPAVAFSVSDLETPADELTLTAHSANEAILASTNILFGGGGEARTLTLMPNGIATGSSLIQVTVTDTNAASATNEFLLTVLPSADLSVTAHGLPNPVVAGYRLTFTVAVTNHGPHTATNVLLANLLPAGAEFVSAGTSHGDCTNESALVSGHLGNLASGETATLSLCIKPTLGGDLTNAFAVTANEGDPNALNNNALVWISVLADSDHDGIPDSWELAHGLLPGDASDATVDADGDGLNNRDEYFAGTNPTNSASVFRVEGLTFEDGRRLHFLSVTGRVYSLYFNDNVTTNSWQEISSQSRVPGTGLPQYLRDTNPPPAVRYYRIGVELP